MNRDTLRIETLPSKKRVGTSISSEYESKTDKDYINNQQKYSDELVNKLFSTEYILDNVETLADGDYPINLFKQLYYAAHIIPDGEPTPISSAKPILSYIGADNL
jgi:hypothetical protein